MRHIFITGCATGFGNHLARKFLLAGDQVYATDPNPNRIEQTLGRQDRLKIIELDLTLPSQVDAAVAQADRIDVLINNGGIGIFGTQEELADDRIRQLFEVNVFGTARLTRAALPKLRASAGTLVQFSSIAGRMVFPESGFYAATKYALEAMSEAIFQEVGSFGIKVRLIQPGSFDTPFIANAAALSDTPRDSSYLSQRPLWDSRREEVLSPAQPPELVVEAVFACLKDPRPFFRIPVGEDAVRILGLRSALTPDAWVRLVGERHGIARGPYSEGDVLSPDEVLEGKLDLTSTFAALSAGYLTHWEESESGKLALHQLNALKN